MKPEAKLNAIIFDGSGVLIDDIETVWRANSDSYMFYNFNGFKSVDEFRSRFRMPIGEFHRANGIPEEMMPPVDKKYREFYSQYQHLVEIFPEVTYVLSELKDRGIKIGMATNIPRKFLGEHLSRFGIGHYFDAVTSQDDCDEQKPSPKPILVTLEKLAVVSSSAAYVGDMDTDMIAGNRAGVYTIAVDNESAYQKIELLKPHADYVVKNLKEVLGFV